MAGKTAGKQDRRIERTRDLLRKAIFALIQEKGFEALSVQNIIDRAGIGRATFYAHYDNKEDLLLSGFDELRAALKQRQQEAQSRGSSADERAFGFSHEMLTHAGEHRTLFQAMVGKRSGAMVQSVLHKLLVDLVRGDVNAMVRRRETDAAELEPLVQFIAGGLFGMLMWWMSAKARPSADEMNAIFRRLAIPSVKAALG